MPAVNVIASLGYQLWGQHTALSTAPVWVAMGSLLGDQMNGMKALRPSCTFMDPAERHKTVGVGCRGLRAVAGCLTVTIMPRILGLKLSPQAGVSQIVHPLPHPRPAAGTSSADLAANRQPHQTQWVEQPVLCKSEVQPPGEAGDIKLGNHSAQPQKVIVRDGGQER